MTISNRNQLLLNPRDNRLYVRFPYQPDLMRFINERLADSTYIEGSTDSALLLDGRPVPATTKPMLYRLADTPETVRTLPQLIRQHQFVVSPRARARLEQQRRLSGGQASAPLSPKEAPLEALESVSKSPVPRKRTPEITGIVGRQPATANQVVNLKIQVPRPGDQDDLRGGAGEIVKTYDGLYDTIMAYPGSQWVKGKKGQYRGYFKVAVTHDTPRMVSELHRRYGLLLAPELPRAIAERLGNLNRDLKLSRISNADLRLPVPSGLDYLPYQKAGIAYAARKGNALIADEPGLGKTIQAIGVANTSRDIRRVLVIVPASLKINWEREWQKWCVKGLTTGRVQGGKPENWPVDNQGREPDVVIINYDVVDQHFDRLTRKPWDLMIVDEAHALKNDKAKRTQLIFGSGRKHAGIPRHRTLLLTGTPILSRPKEVWTLAHALDPDYFSNKLRFCIRYCNAHETEHGWNMDGASNLGELQRELRARIMVRRKKAHVLTELPPKTRQIIPLENDRLARLEAQALATAQRSLRSIRQQWSALVSDQDQSTYRQQAQRLRDMEKAVFEELSFRRKETALAKVPQVMELVEQALESNKKLILFAHHREVVDAYKDALTKLFRKQAGRNGKPATVAAITGVTPNERRQAEADRFQEDPNCRVFIGSIGAAGVGLTLTKASLVLFAELDWVPGNMNQAEDRAHRIGQTDNVLIWHAVVDGSIDARMVRRLIQKQEVIDAALDDPEQAERLGGGAASPEATDDVLTLYSSYLEKEQDETPADRPMDEAMASSRPEPFSELGIRIG